MHTYTHTHTRARLHTRAYTRAREGTRPPAHARGGARMNGACIIAPMFGPTARYGRRHWARVTSPDRCLKLFHPARNPPSTRVLVVVILSEPRCGHEPNLRHEHVLSAVTCQASYKLRRSQSAAGARAYVMGIQFRVKQNNGNRIPFEDHPIKLERYRED